MCAKNDAESLKMAVSQGFRIFLRTVPDILCEGRWHRLPDVLQWKKAIFLKIRGVHCPSRCAIPQKEDPQCLMEETTGWR
jgi:hypothetical protein